LFISQPARASSVSGRCLFLFGITNLCNHIAGVDCVDVNVLVVAVVVVLLFVV